MNDQHLKSLSFQGGQLYSHIAVLGHEIEAVKLCQLLEKTRIPPFGQIQNLIELQYNIAEEMPDEVQLVANTYPARLNDLEDIWAGNVKKYRRRLIDYLTRNLRRVPGRVSLNRFRLKKQPS